MAKKRQTDPLLPEEVAAQLGVQKRHVAVMCIRGDFPGAFLVGRFWRVPPEDVEAYKKRNAKRKGSASSEVA